MQLHFQLTSASGHVTISVETGDLAAGYRQALRSAAVARTLLGEGAQSLCAEDLRLLLAPLAQAA